MMDFTSVLVVPGKKPLSSFFSIEMAEGFMQCWKNCRAVPIRCRSNHGRMLFGVSLMTFTQLSRKCSFILKIKIVRFEYILNSAVDTMT